MVNQSLCLYAFSFLVLSTTALNVHPDLLSFKPTTQSGHQRDTEIIQMQNFSNYLIEQNETAQFELSSFFSGALLDYKLKITNLNGSSIFDEPFYELLINITPPYRNIHQQLINNQSF